MFTVSECCRHKSQHLITVIRYALYRYYFKGILYTTCITSMITKLFDMQLQLIRWPADDQQMTSRWPAVSLLRLSYQLSTLRLIKQLRTIILIRWLEFRHYLTIASQTLKMKIVLTKKCSCHFGSSHIICFPKSMWLSGWGGIFLWYISCLYSVA